MSVLAIIPARYASTRFPGKPLAMLQGKTIIQWVWERVSATPGISATIVATDDQRILDVVQSFGGRAMMTGTNHRSGTDRCGEVVSTLQSQGQSFDIVVNVQGDEPFINASQIADLISCFESPSTQIATLKKPIANTEELLSPNNVKVVTDRCDNAIYFSRNPIPYLRGYEADEWINRQPYYKHIGIYAFRSSTLSQLVKLTQSPLEKSESLEQLRWIENGFDIRVKATEFENIGIDTPEDLALAQSFIQTHPDILSSKK